MSAIDGNGHLFVNFPLDGVDYCVGCGQPKSAPEAAVRCVDAEGLAEDVAVQQTVKAYDWHAPDRGPSPAIEAMFAGVHGALK